MAINFYATGCSYIAHASFSVSPDPYPSGIPCPIMGVSNIKGTITIRANEVTFDSGYGFPAYVYVNGTQVDYLQSTSVSFSSSGVSNVQVVATRTSSTVKNYVTIQKGTGLNRIYYQYTSNGTTYSSSSTNSTLSITADVGTDIVFTNFTFTDATIYGTPITFDEYNSSYSSLIGSWTTATDNKIRVKSSVRYFRFTPSLIESTYYGRLVLNGNGGTFGSQTAINWPSVGYQGASGIGSAVVSIVLPKSTQTSYIPARSGYTFVGWATSSTATSATYISGDTVSFTAKSTYYSSPTEVNLYAVWSQTFTLSYSTSYSGVTNMPSSVTGITSGTGVTVSSKVPVLSGYTFKGWSKTNGGSVQYVAGNSIYITADVTLWTGFEKNQISTFYWDGASGTNDAALIATGQPVSNITASRWNNLLAKIKELADACGASFSYTTVSSGDGITAARFNAARTGLSNIKTALGASTTLPAAQSSGGTIYATLFNGSTSIKGALNELIGVYNNG